jgi:hypothetical protein
MEGNHMRKRKIAAAALIAPLVAGVIPNQSPLDASAATLTTKPVLTYSYNGNIVLSWSQVTGAVSYEVKRDGVKIGEVTGTGFIDTNIEDGAVYSYTVTAKNNTGKTTTSDPVVVTVPVNHAPVVQTKLDGKYINLAKDKVATVGLEYVFFDEDFDPLTYEVHSDNPSVATAKLTSDGIDITGLKQGSATITVKAKDPRGNSVTETFLVNVADKLPVEDFTSIQFEFAKIPNAIEYVIYRNGVKVDQITDTNKAAYLYQDKGLTPGKTYAYQIQPVYSNGAGEMIDIGVLETLDLDLISYVNGNDVDVSWINLKGAEGYKVIFKDESGTVLDTQEVDASTNFLTKHFDFAGTYSVEVIPKLNGTYGQGQSKVFTIKEDFDKAPFSFTIGNTEMTLTEKSKTLDMNDYFSDPDGDTLTYSVTSSDDSVVKADVQGNQIILTAIGKGTATITVTGDDGRGKSSSQTFDVTVLNEAPVGTSIPERTLKVTDAPIVVDIAPYFSDVDDEVLQYQAFSTNNRVATVSIEGSKITITPQEAGSIDVVVKVSDGTETIQQTMKVTVEEVFPQAVQNLRWRAPSYNEAWIAFDPVANADEYIIKRDGKEIARTKENYYIDKTVTGSTTYRYEVISVNEVGEGESRGVNVTTPEKPYVKDLKASVNGTSVNLSWQAFEDADSYRIELFKKDSNGIYKPYSSARSTSALTYEITGLEGGTEYQFRVIPRVNWVYKTEFASTVGVAIANQNSTVSEPVASTEKVQGIKVVTNGTNTADISWSKFSFNGVDASGYRIQAYVKQADGTFVKEGSARTTTALTYKMTNLTIGKEYKFEITPRTNTYLTDHSGMSGVIKIGQVGEVAEEGTTVDTTTTKPTKTTETTPNNETTMVDTESAPVKAVANGSTISLSWNQMDGILRYRVQRYKMVNGEFVADGYAKTTLTASFSESGLAAGTYKYIITPRVGYVYDTQQSIESNSVTIN